jgi:hypothetical protein
MNRKASPSAADVYRSFEQLNPRAKSDFSKLLIAGNGYQELRLDSDLRAMLDEVIEITRRHLAERGKERLREILSRHYDGESNEALIPLLTAFLDDIVRRVTDECRTGLAGAFTECCRRTAEREVWASLYATLQYYAIPEWRAAYAKANAFSGSRVKDPETVQLENDIVALHRDGITKPALIWRALKDTGRYEELSQNYVRKKKSELKQAGRLVPECPDSESVTKKTVTVSKR